MQTAILAPHLVELSSQAVALAASLLVQSTLIVSTALVAASLLRKGGAAVQSSLLRAALVVLWLCPVVAWTLEMAGVSRLRIALPGVSSGAASQRGVTRAASQAVAVLQPSFGASRSSQSSNEGFPVSPPRADQAQSADPQPPRSPGPVAGSADVATRRSASGIHLLYCGLAACWIAVSGLLLTRLGIGCWLVQAARRHSASAESDTTLCCLLIAKAFNVPAPTVLVSGRIHSPCLAGWLRPAILLPDDAGPVSREVLAHEVAHLVRRDCLWNIVGQITAAVLWFQPLMRLLITKMEAAADHVCDDFVVASAHDRQAYARELLAVAERFQPAWFEASAAVGIIPFKSSLGQRVARILDRSRVLCTRTSGPALVGVVITAVLAALLAGLFGAHAGKNALSAEPQQVQGTAAPQAGAAAAPADTDRVAISGQVLDPRGQPLAGARLYLASYASPPKPGPVQATTGPDGRFEFNADRSQLGDLETWDPFDATRLAAVAEGYGLDWVEARELATGKPVTLRPVEDLPINGRILNVEGQPVAGVEVRLVSIRRMALGEYITAVERGQLGAGWGKQWAGPPPEQSETVVSDSEGRFRIAGAGAECLVELRAEEPAIHTTEIVVMTRHTPPVHRPDPRPYWMRSWPDAKWVPALEYPVYGATFDHVSADGRTIRGIVRDKLTSRPVAGVEVVCDAARTVSDPEGYYTLSGVAKGRKYSLLALPVTQPYFGKRIVLTDNAGLAPLDAEIELTRGITVKGRVIDRATGRPIHGIVEYYPLYPNEHAEKLENRVHSRAAIRLDGSYAIAALPGKGVLAVQADAPEFYEHYTPALVTRKELQAFYGELPVHEANSQDSLVIAAGRQNWSTISQTYYNALALIEPGREAESSTMDIMITPGRVLEGRIVASNGEAVSGVKVTGVTAHFASIGLLDTDRFTVKAIDPRRRRRLAFFHPEKRLGALLEVRGDEAGPLAVELKPCGAVIGRLLDADGQPLPDTVIRLDSLLHTSELPAKTDGGGVFRIDGLVPGEKYALELLDGGSVFYDVAAGPGELKDLGEKRLPR